MSRVVLTFTTGAVTVTLSVPLAEPAVAVIIAVPAPTAVTTPTSLTVATERLLEFHDTSARIGLPLAFSGCALKFEVFPTSSELSPPTLTRATVSTGGGLTGVVGVAAGAATLIVAVALTPSPPDTVIVACPGDTVVTKPLDDT